MSYRKQVTGFYAEILSRFSALQSQNKNDKETRERRGERKPKNTWKECDRDKRKKVKHSTESEAFFYIVSQ